jgi:hypothetical protein
MGIEVFPVRAMVARGIRIGVVAVGIGGILCSIGVLLSVVGVTSSDSWPAYLALTLVDGVLFVRFFRASKRLARPAVRVSDDEIVWGPVSREKRTRLPVGEVRSVRSGGMAALDLVSRGGRAVRINTYEIDPDLRPALRQAIERRVRNSPA